MRAVKALIFILIICCINVIPLKAADNPHGDIGLACSNCHTTESWDRLKKDMEFDHDITGFPLIGTHAATACAQCHKSLVFSHIGINCADCHTDIHRGQFGIDCQTCHTPKTWEDREDVLASHFNNGFPLLGVHAVVDCDACHIGQGQDEFTGTPTICQGCHIESYNSTTDPNHVLAGFSLDCQDCHQPYSSSWREAHFEHTAAFPLRGAHALIDCSQCHAQGFAGTPAACLACHESAYNNSSDPPHLTLGFPTDCERCHNETSWQDAQFDHVGISGFALEGAHALISCNSCHADNQYDLPRDCFGCHQSDYLAVDDPDHQAGGFPTDCTQCHNQNAWSPATFDHNLTAFPLTGAHTSVNCAECHINNRYTGTPTDCWSCHENDYLNTNDPNHETNNFDHDCTVCHSTSGWDPSTFNHNQTNFPLTGAHISLNCIQCHAAGYSNTPTDCWSCHENDYRNTDDPNHEANNYPHDCTQCHNTSGWDTDVFNHNNTDFPLTGAHLTLNCNQCHASGYSNTPTDCWSCHETDYRSTTDPDHETNNFDQDCTGCHSTAAWSPSIFDHGQTNFPLSGAHISLNCIQCHAAGYSNTPTDCWSCHETDYRNTNDPDHETNNFSQDCTTCHNTSAWDPATFDHNQTDFPLTGAHISLDCIQCHAGGYSNTPTDCWSCHENDYLNTDDPDHQANNYPHDCTQCHNTSGWDTDVFNHNITDFPLTGAHVTVACGACHTSGYNNTPTECLACHQSDYDGATNPNHRGAGFPTDCVTCHNTNGWDQTTWDHDNQYFPIYSGRHRGEWNLCGDCHVNSNDYGVFECIFCHEHNQNDMDDEHGDVPGYVYSSSACYNCHPRGNE